MSEKELKKQREKFKAIVESLSDVSKDCKRVIQKRHANLPTNNMGKGFDYNKEIDNLLDSLTKNQ